LIEVASFQLRITFAVSIPLTRRFGTLVGGDPLVEDRVQPYGFLTHEYILCFAALAAKQKIVRPTPGVITVESLRDPGTRIPAGP